MRCRSDKQCAQHTGRAGHRAIESRPGLHHIVKLAVLEDPQGWPGEAAPLCHQPAFAWGFHFKEVFAGIGPIAKAANEKRLRADLPVEVHEEPDYQRGYFEEHDVKRKEVLQDLKQQARALPGPLVANVWYWSNPCRSFCDFHLIGPGPRTFQRPEGDGTRQDEVDGNLYANFLAETCGELDASGKVFLFVQQASSGRYPKAWDMPKVIDMIKKTKAVILPTSMCEWGLAPPDQPTLRYRKHCWILVHPRLLPAALILIRKCRRQHTHLQLEGNIPGSGVSRTQGAAAYTEEWATAVVTSCQRAFQGQSPVQPPTTDTGKGHPPAQPYPSGGSRNASQPARSQRARPCRARGERRGAFEASGGVEGSGGRRTSRGGGSQPATGGASGRGGGAARSRRKEAADRGQQPSRTSATHSSRRGGGAARSRRGGGADRSPQPSRTSRPGSRRGGGVYRGWQPRMASRPGRSGRRTLQRPLRRTPGGNQAGHRRSGEAWGRLRGGSRKLGGRRESLPGGVGQKAWPQPGGPLFPGVGRADQARGHPVLESGGNGGGPDQAAKPGQEIPRQAPQVARRPPCGGLAEDLEGYGERKNPAVLRAVWDWGSNGRRVQFPLGELRSPTQTGPCQTRAASSTTRR